MFASTSHLLKFLLAALIAANHFQLGAALPAGDAIAGVESYAGSLEAHTTAGSHAAAIHRIGPSRIFRRAPNHLANAQNSLHSANAERHSANAQLHLANQHAHDPIRHNSHILQHHSHMLLHHSQMMAHHNHMANYHGQTGNHHEQQQSLQAAAIARQNVHHHMNALIPLHRDQMDHHHNQMEQHTNVANYHMGRGDQLAQQASLIAAETSRNAAEGHRRALAGFHLHAANYEQSQAGNFALNTYQHNHHMATSHEHRAEHHDLVGNIQQSNHHFDRAEHYENLRDNAH